MDSQGLNTCATVKFASAARLLPTSWCPDKDLILVIMNAGDKERLALWPREGGRKMWEVDCTPTAPEPGGKAVIAAFAWSPDGLQFAVAHDPPAITIHSLQDGQLIRKIVPATPTRSLSRVINIWWFNEHRPKKNPDIPDIFKRRGDITGSAHSILKSQPLLDPLHDDSQPLSSSELFAFESSHTRSASRSSMPTIISSWPMLPPNLRAASFYTAGTNGQHQRPGEELDEVDDSNVNSVLVVADDLGKILGYLDGSYPLGTIELGPQCVAHSLHKGSNMRYFLYPEIETTHGQYDRLRPVVIDIPLLQQRLPRNAARVSTSARELAWYVMRVVKEMRSTWFGAEGHQGAREIGPKWVRALEQRQKEKYGVEDPNAILDLTVLLTTGRAPDSLSDFLGSGEQMTDRSIGKWEASVTEALLKLRDYATKRVAPACQRLHVLLQEVLGWSKLPQYALFHFSTDVQYCLDHTARAIFCASWLAAAIGRELPRFREFMAWLRHESFKAANKDADVHTPPSRHDVLEVNEYLMSGLVVSSIDRWFMGTLPKFSLSELAVPHVQKLNASMDAVSDILGKADGVTWPPPAHHQNLSRYDRNLDLLIQDLCARCHRIFSEASEASARSAVISFGPGEVPVEKIEEEHAAPIFSRERTVDDADRPNSFVQHRALVLPHGDGESLLCLVQTHHDKDVFRIGRPVGIAVLHCSVALPAQEGTVPVEILNAEFFDDSVLVIVYRPRQREHGPTSIAIVNYADQVYETITSTTATPTQEALIALLLQRLKDGQTSSVPLRLIQARPLIGCREGTVTLAVNGRVGRRVACVLDDAGTTLEVLDIESPYEDEAEEMQTEDT